MPRPGVGKLGSTRALPTTKLDVSNRGSRGFKLAYTDHDATASDVARLVALCDLIACDPRKLTHHARELSELAARLEATFAAHLALEERTLFPILRTLPLATQDEILQEIRARHPW